MSERPPLVRAQCGRALRWLVFLRRRLGFVVGLPMRAAKRDAKIADAELNRPKKPKRARPKRPLAYGSPWSGRKQAPQWTAGRSTTMPRHPKTDEYVNEKRRERRKAAAQFYEAHGRSMNPKDVKRQKCETRGVPYRGNRVAHA